MKVATNQVGVKDLKNNLSAYLDDIAGGATIIVTERGRPIARILHIDASTAHLADLVERGLVQPPLDPTRRRPAKRIKASGSVSELVSEQRR